MAKQTAVDLFMAYVSKHKEFLGYDLDEVYKQAKEMENKQIQKAFSDGQELSINNPLLPHYSSEEYYNDTYGNL